MMSPLQKNIIKTILILVVVMATILTLFLNKITTPRYLSNIELKINGLVLVKTNNQQLISFDTALSDTANSVWYLVSQSDKDKEMLAEFYAAVKRSIQEKIALGELNNKTSLPRDVPQNSVLITRPNGTLIGYFKPPYDEHKMILTLSSVMAHR